MILRNPQLLKSQRISSIFHCLRVLYEKSMKYHLPNRGEPAAEVNAKIPFCFERISSMT